MDRSAASYANDQLGYCWDSLSVPGRMINRATHIARSKRSISHLLGGSQANGPENQNRSGFQDESLSSFGATNNSTVAAKSDDYLKTLITDNEIAQIRSENESLLNKLLSQYVFEDGTKVRTFLEDHPSVPHFLFEALPFLKKSFGDNAILQLQIPPDEDGPFTIYAVAIWEDTVEAARNALKNFDDSWWIANGHKASGKVVVDYQLV